MVITMRSQILALGGWLLLTFLTALSGAFFMPGEWYDRLIKPWWNPPNWVFPIVWTVLYIMIANAAWLVWRAKGFSGAGFALQLFIAQLVVNALWSYLFFGLHSPFLALLDVIVMWLMILATLIAFWQVNLLAGILMIPYLVWVSIAAFLNFTIWRLNS